MVVSPGVNCDEMLRSSKDTPILGDREFGAADADLGSLSQDGRVVEVDLRSMNRDFRWPCLQRKPVPSIVATSTRGISHPVWSDPMTLRDNTSKAERSLSSPRLMK